MNYVIKSHAQFVEKMYNELREQLPTDASNTGDLRRFLTNLRTLSKYTATVYKMAITEEN